MLEESPFKRGHLVDQRLEHTFSELYPLEHARVLTFAFLLQDNPPYDKGAFRIEINFPAEYPFKPPKITFKTKIYHPNIDEKGQVCLPVISAENWKPATKTDQGRTAHGEGTGYGETLGLNSKLVSWALLFWCIPCGEVCVVSQECATLLESHFVVGV